MSDFVVPEAALVEVLSASKQAGFLGAASIESQIVHARGLLTIAAAACPLPFASPSPGTPEATIFVDLGSGGGLPGLVGAHDWRWSRWWLIEASQRRSDFLRWAISRLELTDRVEVIEAPAELVGHDPLRRGGAGVVLARGFGPPATTAECASPLLTVGGLLVVSEPPNTAGQRWPLAVAHLGLALRRVEVDPVAAAVLHRVGPCPDRYPRRPNLPRRAPLF